MGVAMQIAPRGDFARDDNTPIGVPTLRTDDTGTHEAIKDPHAAEARLQRRVKETSQAVSETFSVAADTSARVDEANVGITTLRMETKAHIDGIKIMVEEIYPRLDGFTAHLTAQDGKIEAVGVEARNAAVEARNVGGKVDNLLPKLIDALASDRAANRADDHVRLTATVDVDTHRKKAEIDDDKDKKSTRRKIGAGAITGVIGLLSSGAFLGYLITHASC